MLLAEQLLLLALDPQKGRPGLGKRDALEPGLCGRSSRSWRSARSWRWQRDGRSCSTPALSATTSSTR